MGQLNAAETNAEAASAFDVVHADILRFFPEVVAGLGGDPEKLLQQVGRDAASLSDGEPSYRLFVNLLEYAAAELGCADFGMRLATRQGGGSVFGPMGIVMKNSNTLGQAVVARHVSTLLRMRSPLRSAKGWHLVFRARPALPHRRTRRAPLRGDYLVHRHGIHARGPTDARSSAGRAAAGPRDRELRQRTGCHRAPSSPADAASAIEGRRNVVPRSQRCSSSRYRTLLSPTDEAGLDPHRPEARLCRALGVDA